MVSALISPLHSFSPEGGHISRSKSTSYTTHVCIYILWTLYRNKFFGGPPSWRINFSVHEGIASSSYIQHGHFVVQHSHVNMNFISILSRKGSLGLLIIHWLSSSTQIRFESRLKTANLLVRFAGVQSSFNCPVAGGPHLPKSTRENYYISKSLFF